MLYCVLFANSRKIENRKSEKLSVMAIAISILLDTRRIKKFDKYPVKLRVTFDRKSEYFQTTLDVSAKILTSYPPP